MPSLTNEDSASLKNILLDSMDDLKASGLNEEEAFEIASIRLGINSDFEEECGMLNSDTLLIRKILLVFTGMMIFFLLHYSMLVCEGSMFYFLHDLILNPHKIFRYTLNFLIGYHLIFLLATIAVFKWNKEFFKKIDDFRINPLHVLFLMLLVFVLGFTNYKLIYLVRTEIPYIYFNTAKYPEMISCSSYSFSFLAAVCFLILLKRNNYVSRRQNRKAEKNHSGFDECIKNSYSQPFMELTNEGWDEEEAVALIKIRYKISTPSDNKKVNRPVYNTKAVKFPLIALSGPLIYLFLYYLLNSTTRIFLSVLQYFENEPVKNFGWTEWYIASFNLLLIFFTTSLYIKDKDLLQKLKEINSGKFYALFFTTILLGIIDNIFLPVSRMSLRNITELKVKFNDVIIFSDLIFSIVISFCFFILFTKYYNENIKEVRD